MEEKRGKGVKTLSDRIIRKILQENPTVTSLEEMCAIWDCEVSTLDDDDREYAEKMINRNILRLKVLLKQALYAANNRQAQETLYRLIGNEDDLKRLGSNVNTKITQNGKTVIEIKSASPETQEKLKNL